MKKSDRSHRWFGSWRAAERTPQDDPADLGTAFGLDLSMSEQADPPAPATAPADARSGWMQRMTALHRPAF
jgi:hypothetical protein